jgi:hypothetical protein
MPLERNWHYSRVFIKIRAACSYLAQEIKLIHIQTWCRKVVAIDEKFAEKREFIKRKKEAPWH